MTRLSQNEPLASIDKCIASPEDSYVAVIGDLVRSRSIPFRGQAQEALFSLLNSINQSCKDELASEFTITTGDEFQGLVGEPSILPDLLVRFEREFTYAAVRFGIGKGALTTKLAPSSIGMDGPAWHQARDAVNEAKSASALGGVYRGFGPVDDIVLNALARQGEWYRERYYRKYGSMFIHLEEGLSHTETARLLNRNRQQISQQVSRTGWRTYWSGQEALRALLHEHRTVNWGGE